MYYSKVIIAISLAFIVSLIVYIFNDANVVDKEVGVPSLFRRGLLHLRGLKKKKKKRGKANKSGKGKRSKAGKAGKNDNVFIHSWDYDNVPDDVSKDSSKDYEVNNVSNLTTQTPTPAAPIPSDNDNVPVVSPKSVYIPLGEYAFVDVFEVQTDEQMLSESDLKVTTITRAASNADCSIGLDFKSVMVTPHAEFIGSDYCEYEACDEQNMCSMATITFTVEDVDTNNESTPAPAPVGTEEEYEVEAISRNERGPPPPPPPPTVSVCNCNNYMNCSYNSV